MDIHLEEEGNLKRLLKITIDKNIVNQEFENAIKSIQKDVKIDGFRPGKVPKNIIEKRYINELTADVHDKLIEKAMIKAEQKYKLEFAYKPDILVKQLSKDSDFICHAKFEIFPKISVIPFEEFNLERSKANVSQEIVDNNIKLIEYEFSKYDKVEDIIKEYDRANIIIKGIENGKVSYNEKGEGSIIQPGTKQHIDEIEQGIIGMTIDEEKTILVKVKDQKENKDKSNLKDIEYKVKVVEINRPRKFKWSEEVIKKINPDFTTFDQVKDHIKNHLIQLEQNKIDQDCRTKMRAKLTKDLSFDLPEKVLKDDFEAKKEQDELLKSLKTGLENAKEEGKKEVIIKKEKDKAEEKITIKECNKRIKEREENLHESLQKELRFSYYMTKIAKQENINPRSDVVNYMFSEAAYQFKLNPKDLAKAPLGKKIFNNLQYEDINNQVLNWHFPSK